MKCAISIFLIAIIFSLNFELCFCLCALSEYELDGECCPKCAPGYCVYKHCTEDTPSCVQCPALTYIDVPNGLLKCFNCTVCDSGQGLRINTACTRSSDTVCESVEGYYCTDQYKGSCKRAEKHTNCSPGQYIKQRGTTIKDTECAECPDGTFSDGSLQICQPRSQCEDLGITEIKPGTISSECGNKQKVALTAGIIVSILGVVAVAVLVVLKFKQRADSSPRSGTPE